MAAGSPARERGFVKNRTKTTIMTHEILKAAFLQGGEREAASLLNDIMQKAVRAALFDAMSAEVEALCGPRHKPAPEATCRRAGSEEGIAYLGGEKEQIRRPRVRDEGGEVELQTYKAASSQQGVFDEVVSAVAAGATIRGVARTGMSPVSKSAGARMWEEKSREKLEEFRSRSLSERDWKAIMIDGVWVGDEICVVVAIGVDIKGTKMALDFEPGTSESATCVSALIERLVSRGFVPEKAEGLLVCRDGSNAIRKAVSKHWPWALQQECLVHCERNVTDKLKRSDRRECRRLFRRFREVEGLDAGEEAFSELLAFVESRNTAAGKALLERKPYLLTLHRLEVPSTLNRTFLSTNCIENMIRNWRAATKGIKRWRESGDMVDRWTASGLLHAESGFRKVAGHEDMPALAEALRSPSLGASCGSGLRPSPPSAPREGEAACQTEESN